MKLFRLGLVLVLVLTGCNQADTTKQQIKDNTTNKVSNVSNTNNKGKAIGKEYGGKGTGYGQVKKIEPSQTVPPLVEAPTPTKEEDLIAKSVSELTHWDVKRVEVKEGTNPVVLVYLNEAPSDPGYPGWFVQDKEMTIDTINYHYGNGFVNRYSDLISTPEGELYIKFYKVSPAEEIPNTIEGVVIALDKVLTEQGYEHGKVSIGYNSGVQLIYVEGDSIEMNEEISFAVHDLTGFYLDNVGYTQGKNAYLPLDFNK
jgi:hypothetical protein